MTDLTRPVSVDDINGVNADRRRYAALTGQLVTGGGDGRRSVGAWSEVGMGNMRPPSGRIRETVQRPVIPVERLLKDRYYTSEARYLGAHKVTRAERRAKTLEALGIL